MTNVEALLTNYKELKRTLDLLAFRIKYFSGLSGDHIIEELTFTSPQGERVTTSGVSDKTLRIALEYQNVSYNQGKEILQELIGRHNALKSDIDFLELCISLLEKELSDVATDLFINGMDSAQIGAKYNLSRSSINRYRLKAIAEITKMYQEILMVG